MRTEVITFDRGGAFEPRTFTLIAPTKWSKLGWKNAGPGPKKTKGRPRVKAHVTKNVRTSPQYEAAGGA